MISKPKAAAQIRSALPEKLAKRLKFEGRAQGHPDERVILIGRFARTVLLRADDWGAIGTAFEAGRDELLARAQSFDESEARMAEELAPFEQALDADPR